jgi:hypothetical protein
MARCSLTVRIPHRIVESSADHQVVKFAFNSLTSLDDLERVKVSHPTISGDHANLLGLLQGQGCVASSLEICVDADCCRHSKVHACRFADIRGYRGFCQLGQQGSEGRRAGELQ